MESNSIKLKVSYIFISLNRKRAIFQDIIQLLLTEDLKIPSVTINNLKDFNDPIEMLKGIHEDYLKYSFDFVIERLAKIRFIDHNICEVTYIASLNYIPGFNKKGRVFSLNELVKQNIDIEEYYGEIISRNSSNIFG